MMWLNSLKILALEGLLGKRSKQRRMVKPFIHEVTKGVFWFSSVLFPAGSPSLDFSSMMALLSRLYSWRDRLWSLQAMTSYCGGISEILSVAITSAQPIFYFSFCLSLSHQPALQTLTLLLAPAPSALSCFCNKLIRFFPQAITLVFLEFSVRLVYSIPISCLN